MIKIDMPPRRITSPLVSTPCGLFTDTSDHVISRLHAGCDMIIDSGSKITTEVKEYGLQSYVKPSFTCILPPVRWSHQQLHFQCCARTHRIFCLASYPQRRHVILWITINMPSLATIAIAQLWFVSPSRTLQTLSYVDHTSSYAVHLSPPSVDMIQSGVPIMYQFPSVHE
jgi:hypothetical protein